MIVFVFLKGINYEKDFVFNFYLNVFCSCKTSNSDTSYVAEDLGKKIYLYESSTGKDKTPIVCRFSCSEIPTLSDKNSVCSSPLYIKESVLTNSNLSNFLEYIKENDRVLARKDLDPSTEDTIASLFAQAEKEQADKLYDTSIGDASEVCSVVLNSSTSGGVVTTNASSFSEIKLEDFTLSPLCHPIVGFERGPTTTDKTPTPTKELFILVKGNDPTICISKNLFNKFTPISSNRLTDLVAFPFYFIDLNILDIATINKLDLDKGKYSLIYNIQVSGMNNSEFFIHTLNKSRQQIPLKQGYSVQFSIQTFLKLSKSERDGMYYLNSASPSDSQFIEYSWKHINLEK